MNYGSRVLLSFDEQGREVSGGDSDVSTRGGVFGPQGYGGGIFDGSMDGLDGVQGMGGLGGIGDVVTDCAIMCATLMPTLGPIGVAACVAKCNENVGTKDCFVPSVCKSVAAKFPQLLDPNIITTYCDLPPETQTAIESQCNAITWAVEQSGGAVPPASSLPLPVPVDPQPTLPPPEPGPGPLPTPPPATDPAVTEAKGISGGLVAAIACVGIVGLAIFFTGGKSK